MQMEIFSRTLLHGESYTNNTNEPQFFKISYYNSLGHKQTDTRKLQPNETIVSKNPFSKITIL